MWQTIFRGWSELSPSCTEATRLQAEALDGQLGLGQRIGLRVHLLLCQWCRRYGKHIKFLRSAARQHEEHDNVLSSQSLRPAARERIKRRLQEEENNSPPKFKELTPPSPK